MDEIKGLVEQISDTKLKLYDRLSEHFYKILDEYNADKSKCNAVSNRNKLGILMRLFAGNLARVEFADDTVRYLKLQSPVIDMKDYDVLYVGIEFFDE